MDDTKPLLKQMKDVIREIASLDIPIPGSIHSMYLRCGKKQCRCHQSDEFRHGPYYLWYRRVGGKLTTKSICEQDVALYQQWIANREKLEACVQKIISLGEDYAARYRTRQDKSKKSPPSMRGK